MPLQKSTLQTNLLLAYHFFVYIIFPKETNSNLFAFYTSHILPLFEKTPSPQASDLLFKQPLIEITFCFCFCAKLPRDKCPSFSLWKKQYHNEFSQRKYKFFFTKKYTQHRRFCTQPTVNFITSSWGIGGLKRSGGYHKLEGWRLSWGWGRKSLRTMNKE